MSEKKKIVRYKIYFNYENEERWINEMSREGLDLVDYAVGKYTFERGTPGEYIYRYQYLSTETPEEVQEYISFLEEGGIEVIGSYFGWLIMRKKTSEGSFEVFTDDESKIHHYQSIIRVVNIVAIVNLVLGIVNVTSPFLFNRSISILSFSTAAILFIVIGSYSSHVRKLSEKINLKNNSHHIDQLKK